MSEHEIKGRDRERDPAEEWLANNDPNYAEQKKSWQTPSTDALARDRTKHATLKDLLPVGPGLYRRLNVHHGTNEEGTYDPEDIGENSDPDYDLEEYKELKF